MSAVLVNEKAEGEGSPDDPVGGLCPGAGDNGEMTAEPGKGNYLEHRITTAVKLTSAFKDSQRTAMHYDESLNYLTAIILSYPLLGRLPRPT